jgi:hypothetical protein
MNTETGVSSCMIVPDLLPDLEGSAAAVRAPLDEGFLTSLL